MKTKTFDLTGHSWSRAKSAGFLCLLLVIVLGPVFLAGACGSIDSSGIKVIPPPQGVYHSAFPDFGPLEGAVTAESVTDFERLVGRKIVWAYFSNNWHERIEFPEDAVRAIHDVGVIPFIRMMPWSYENRYSPDPVYTMQRIIDGEFDQDLRGWARDAKRFGAPLMVEFGTEVNGDWFPWSGLYSGGGEIGGYGDLRLADGPERFRDAFRRIVGICRQEGAHNITWVFHVNDGSFPQEAWNTMAAYYPGDEYVDWIGVSIYGPQRPGEEWKMFSELADIAYAELAEISDKKPLAVLEFGVVDDPKIGDKASWIREALQSVRSERYPRVRAISYWHENWENDDGSISNLRLDSSPEALAAYREEIADLFFVTTIYTSLVTGSTESLTTTPGPSMSSAVSITETGGPTTIAAESAVQKPFDLNLVSIVAVAGLLLALVSLGIVRIWKQRKP